jgi:hypothetical protein
MNEILVAKFNDHAIAKTQEYSFSAQREIENADSVSAELVTDIDLDSARNMVLRGFDIEPTSPASMSIILKAGSGLDAALLRLLQTDSDTTLSVDAASASDRIDIVEVQRVLVDYATSSRSHRNASDGSYTVQGDLTKRQYNIVAQVTKGTPGSGVAPNQSAGWMKLAEIAVPNGTSQLVISNIKGCTAGYSGEVNTGWTAQTALSYRHKTRRENKKTFRQKHLETGDHGNAVIRASHVVFGVGADEVDSDILPLGTAVASAPTGGTATNLAAGATTRAALQEALDRLIDLSGAGNLSIKKRHLLLGMAGDGINAGLLPIADGGSYFAAVDVMAALAETLTRLAAKTSGNGASLIGLQDAGGMLVAATVEAALAEIKQTQVGETVAFPTKPETGVTGWLYCDGTVIDKSVTPKYTHLVDKLKAEAGADAAHPYYDANANRAKLPDHRGYPIRGVDTSGASYDPDGRRKSGAYQDSAFLSHQHSVSQNADSPTHTHRDDSGYSINGGLNTGGVTGTDQWGNNTHTHSVTADTDHTHTLTTNSGGDSSVETAVRNVALFWYIKL